MIGVVVIAVMVTISTFRTSGGYTKTISPQSKLFKDTGESEEEIIWF
jgi:hypothetical protein